MRSILSRRKDIGQTKLPIHNGGSENFVKQQREEEKRRKIRAD